MNNKGRNTHCSKSVSIPSRPRHITHHTTVSRVAYSSLHSPSLLYGHSTHLITLWCCTLRGAVWPGNAYSMENVSAGYFLPYVNGFVRCVSVINAPVAPKYEYIIMSRFATPFTVLARVSGVGEKLIGALTVCYWVISCNAIPRSRRSFRSPT